MNPTRADRQEILAQLARFAMLTRGVEDNARYLDEFADDATLLPPERPALSGRRAIEAYYEQALRLVDAARVTYEEPAIDLDGALAVRRYTATAVVRLKCEEAERITRTKYLDVLKKDADGSWRIAVHMWSSNEGTATADDDGD